MNANEEIETLRGVCRMLIVRILEANSVRELLQESVLKETKKVIPDIIDNLMLTYNQNKTKFETQSVNPAAISDIANFHAFLSNCEAPDMIRLAEIARFIMEGEIHNIIGAILDKQN
ncbi:hypothetical protein PBCVNEJV1_502L [Paramecium bursaria Chlorella virus NE-JV-1]|nr:hypothetical protein PBCVNEJV1_502L [Paramecium bursaria Chlorella virus NE-JV-1]